MGDMNQVHSATSQPTSEEPGGQPAASPPPRSNLPLLIVLVVVIALIAGAGLWWRNFTTSPSYSLGQLAKAVQDKDWDGVQKYVDTDAIIDQAMDVLASQAPEEVDSGWGVSGAALLDAWKPALKDSIRKAIEEGGGGSLGSSSLTSILAADRVKSVTYIGDEALVTIEVPRRGGKSMDLKLRMTRFDDFWRITAIENIDDLPIGEMK